MHARLAQSVVVAALLVNLVACGEDDENSTA